MNRGVERRTIFLDDDDRHRFVAHLSNVVHDRGWQLIAFVLMANHYHLFVRTPQPNLSRGMQDLDGSYAAAFNERHERVGHLFQGRFRSHLVDSDAYLLEVARYVVLNPVRAGLVDAPGDWMWSSYRATAGLAAIPSWLDPAPLLDRFDPQDWNRAKCEYRAFVAKTPARSPWEDLAAQMALGTPEFLRSVETRVRERKCGEDHLRDQRTFRGVTISEVRKALDGIEGDARALFVILATRHTHATRAAIGREVGITGAGVSYIVRSASDRIREDREFAERVKKLEASLKGDTLDFRSDPVR
jgi:putative transposase